MPTSSSAQDYFGTTSLNQQSGPGILNSTDLSAYWIRKNRDSFRRCWSYQTGKRLFDVALALALLPFLFPISLLLMLLVKCSSKGPVFYKHLRVGQDGHAFYLYKFRTMFLHGDALLRDYLNTDPEARQEWEEHYKLRQDPRVTPLGAVLRRASLDELPQIVNVLLGHMSFVGPRPIVLDEISRYGESPGFGKSAEEALSPTRRAFLSTSTT